MMTNQRSMLLFEQAIKSEVTKKTYIYQLTKFKDWAKIKNYDGLLQAPDSDLQIMIEDYVMHLKKSLSPNSIPIYFAPIELFYVMNDKNLNFKKIRKLFPQKVKKGNERGYSREEIKTILNGCKTKRHRALILILASSGCRIGALPDIRLNHMTKIEESYAIKIYEGEKEEDFIFTTPEATKAIDAYLDERKQDREYMDSSSPLFRNSYQMGIEKVKLCSTDNITHITGRLIAVIDRKRTGKTKRFEIAKNHGFRKYFATCIKSTEGVTATMTEKLINHVGIVQMDGAYFTPTMEKMFESYKKSIPELTIDRTKIQEQKIRLLEHENITNKQLRRELVTQKEQTEEYVDSLKKQVAQIEKNSLDYQNTVDSARKQGLDHATKMIENTKKEISPDKIQQILDILKA